MIMLSCILNAAFNLISFMIWYKTVKDRKLKAHDAKGYFMILVFVILLIAFAVGIVGQEQVAPSLILINTAISLVSLTGAFVLIKDPIEY
ncbi:hypothetical protein [Marinicellulosiphila megalodicopiae]|uniref:hypothetical protein n=1 Tax=Marinicellulosiphila megalodicopiae TaxID=2724896 RepID=UPI003BAFCE69